MQNTSTAPPTGHQQCHPCTDSYGARRNVPETNFDITESINMFEMGIYK